ncbi:MAG: nuclear transport factor 2 family protein [Balneola sp.]
MKKYICIFGLIVILGINAQAQTPEKEVQAVIETLFDGMRAGDSTMVASAFSRDAIMQTVAKNQQGNVIKIEGNLAKFLNAVGTPHDQVWDEKIGGYEIKIDGDLASAWTPYEFYLGDNFSHCGVNSFQLARLDGEWKIIYIVDTRRRTNCIE